MNTKLLIFELAEEMDAIEIHANQQGLQELIDRLFKLKKSFNGSSSEHEHLMTPDWGGTELTGEKQGKDSILINKVTIHLWQ
jgi:hypothetical protein